MKMSNALISTLKEAPHDAVIPSHILMMRTGMIRKTASGFYTFLPLGLRVLRRVENVIRRYMDQSGALEMTPPLLTPRELWIKSGRWDRFKNEKLLMTTEDRGGSVYALGPTHEEIFTDMVSKQISSYKNLPVNVYQINTKFRDEIRPRFGIMRCKEFIMKDAYSFHNDYECLDKTYKSMSMVYKKIFKTLGLDFVSVRADSGAMGGSGSEEFMVRSDVGEEEILTCGSCDYAANTETAVENIPQAGTWDGAEAKPELIDTPSVKTIDALAEFFQCSPKRFIKSLVYKVVSEQEGTAFFAMILVRGDYELNEVKLANLFSGETVLMASAAEVKQCTGTDIGFVGPYNLPPDSELRIFADISIKGLVGAVTGGNQNDKHYKNISVDRDLSIDRWVEVYTARGAGSCVECGGTLNILRGIEVGHVFKLGDKYTKAFGMTVLDENGKKNVPVMGCYGIGVGRTLAAIIEQYHDESGIVWPYEAAPYQVHILSLDINDREVMDSSNRLYHDLTDSGYDVLWDERKERPGVKFHDADLIGIPVQVVIGSRGLSQGYAEIKVRRDMEKVSVPLDGIFSEVCGRLKVLVDEMKERIREGHL